MLQTAFGEVVEEDGFGAQDDITDDEMDFEEAVDDAVEATLDYLAFEATLRRADQSDAFTTHAFETSVRPSPWYECVQVLEADSYTAEQVARL